jgi:peptide/nickel transport system substrate-binding protein
MALERDALTRRQVLRGAAAGALALGGVSALSACGRAGSVSAGTTASAGPPAGGTPVKGGTLRTGWIGAGRSETINPAQAGQEVDIFRGQQLFDGLFVGGADGAPKPQLAVSAEPNADATVWTLTLRDGVTWHDGKPLIAEDVAATMRTWGNADANYAAGLVSVLIDAKAVRARGRLTVEVPTLRPLADFAGVAANPNLLITRIDSFHGGKAIGTGPFIMESFSPGVQSVFKANPRYWGGAPYVEQQVANSSYTDETARLNALLAGELDIAPSIPFELARTYANGGQVFIGRSGGANHNYVACRTDLAPFNDPRVIRALKLLVNGPQIVTSALAGYGSASNQVPCKGAPYWADLEWPGYDPEQAKSLLKQAGQEDLAKTLLTSDIYAGLVNMTTIYSQDARAAGVTLKPQLVDPSIYYTSSGPDGGYMSYPMFTEMSGGGGELDSLTSYYLQVGWTGAEDNETHVSDKKFDALLFDAIGELDKAKATEKWRAYQQYFVDHSGVVVLANIDYVDAYGKNVRGIRTAEGGPINNYVVYKGWLA